MFKIQLNSLLESLYSICYISYNLKHVILPPIFSIKTSINLIFFFLHHQIHGSLLTLLPLHQHCCTSLITDFIPHIRNIPNLDINCTILQNPFTVYFLPFTISFVCLVTLSSTISLTIQSISTSCSQLIKLALLSLFLRQSVCTTILGNIFPITDINTYVPFLTHSCYEQHLPDGQNRPCFQCCIMLSQGITDDARQPSDQTRVVTADISYLILSLFYTKYPCMDFSQLYLVRSSHFFFHVIQIDTSHLLLTNATSSCPIIDSSSFVPMYEKAFILLLIHSFRKQLSMRPNIFLTTLIPFQYFLPPLNILKNHSHYVWKPLH